MYDFVAAQGPQRSRQAALVIPGCERYLAGCRSGVQIARVFERGQEFLAAWLRTRTAQRVDHRQCAGHSVKCQGLDSVLWKILAVYLFVVLQTWTARGFRKK